MILCEFVVEVQNWFGLELGFLYLLLSKAQAGTEAYFNDCPLLFYTGYCSSCFTGVRVPLHFFTFLSPGAGLAIGYLRKQTCESAIRVCLAWGPAALWIFHCHVWMSFLCGGISIHLGCIACSTHENQLWIEMSVPHACLEQAGELCCSCTTSLNSYCHFTISRLKLDLIILISHHLFNSPLLLTPQKTAAAGGALCEVRWLWLFHWYSSWLSRV